MRAAAAGSSRLRHVFAARYVDDPDDCFDTWQREAERIHMATTSTSSGDAAMEEGSDDDDIGSDSDGEQAAHAPAALQSLLQQLPAELQSLALELSKYRPPDLVQSLAHVKAAWSQGRSADADERAHEAADDEQWPSKRHKGNDGSHAKVDPSVAVMASSAHNPDASATAARASPTVLGAGSATGPPHRGRASRHTGPQSSVGGTAAASSAAGAAGPACEPIIPASVHCAAFPSPNARRWGTDPYLWENCVDDSDPLSSFLLIPRSVIHPSTYAHAPIVRDPDSYMSGCECPNGECRPATCSCAHGTDQHFTPGGRIQNSNSDQRYMECWDKCSCACREKTQKKNEEKGSGDVETTQPVADSDARRNNHRRLPRGRVSAYTAAGGAAPSCYNRVVQRGPVAPGVRLVVFRTSDGRGWGLKTLDRISGHCFVCEYIGERLHEYVTEARGVAQAKREEMNFIFSFKPKEQVAPDWDVRQQQQQQYDSDCDSSSVCSSAASSSVSLIDNASNEAFSLDARLMGHVARFANHSCTPNMVAVEVLIEYRDPRLPRVAFFTKKQGVPPGGELTFDYGDMHEQGAGGKSHGQFTCRCAPCVQEREEEARAEQEAQEEGDEEDEGEAEGSSDEDEPFQPAARPVARPTPTRRVTPHSPMNPNGAGHGDEPNLTARKSLANLLEVDRTARPSAPSATWASHPPFGYNRSSGISTVSAGAAVASVQAIDASSYDVSAAVVLRAAAVPSTAASVSLPSAGGGVVLEIETDEEADDDTPPLVHVCQPVTAAVLPVTATSQPVRVPSPPVAVSTEEATVPSGATVTPLFPNLSPPVPSPPLAFPPAAPVPVIAMDFPVDPMLLAQLQGWFTAAHPFDLVLHQHLMQQGHIPQLIQQQMQLSGLGPMEIHQLHHMMTQIQYAQHVQGEQLFSPPPPPVPSPCVSLLPPVQHNAMPAVVLQSASPPVTGSLDSLVHAHSDIPPQGRKAQQQPQCRHQPVNSAPSAPTATAPPVASQPPTTVCASLEDDFDDVPPLLPFDALPATAPTAASSVNKSEQEEEKKQNGAQAPAKFAAVATSAHDAIEVD